jgi:hypothetical protein
MSSHHIVREAQEPALVWATRRPFSDLVGQLLEWSPVVLVPEIFLAQAVPCCKVDVAVGTEEPRVEEWLRHQHPYHFARAQSDALPDALTASLDWLLREGHTAANLLLDGPPADWASFLAPYTALLTLVAYTDAWRWQWLPQGRYEKWLPAGQVLSWEKAPQRAEGIQEMGSEGRCDTPGFARLAFDGPCWLGERLPSQDASVPANT